MIEALKHMDGMAQLALVVLLMIMTYRVTAGPSRPRHVMWFAGIITLIPVVFLATRDVAMAIDPYVSSFAILSLGLLSAGFLLTSEVGKRLTPYYIMYLIAVLTVYVYSAHYENQGLVLLTPSFLALAIPIAAILLISPIMAMSSGKTSIHSLWLVMGLAVTLAAGYVMWGMAVERIVLEGDMETIVPYTTLAAGLVLMVVGYLATPEWLGSEDLATTPDEVDIAA